jgi:Domain of Unknown Function (DUF748)
MDSRGRKWWRSSTARWVVLGLVVVLAVARLLMPYGVERYVNRQLNKSRDYSGRIGNVHIQLWRGRYRIDDVSILKRSGTVRTPFFSANQVFLAIQWDELFHGSVVGQVIMEQPHVNFVSGPTEEQSQSGKGTAWNEILKSLFPFDINRLAIYDGQVHFQNQYSTPPVDIYLNGLTATATNLNNSRDLHTNLASGIKASGTTIGGGALDLSVQLDPMAPAPTYQLTAQLTNVDLPALNSFLKAYGKFDVESGRFAIFTSIASKEGTYDGYAKVFFERLHVFSWEKEKKKNVLGVFWEAIVGTLTTAFKNQKHDYLATRIPISGSYGKEKLGTWPAIATLLRNAFIKALEPKIDEKVTVKNVEQKQESEGSPEPSPPPPQNGGQALAKPER